MSAKKKRLLNMQAHVKIAKRRLRTPSITLKQRDSLKNFRSMDLGLAVMDLIYATSERKPSLCAFVSGTLSVRPYHLGLPEMICYRTMPLRRDNSTPSSSTMVRPIVSTRAVAFDDCQNVLVFSIMPCYRTTLLQSVSTPCSTRLFA